MANTLIVIIALIVLHGFVIEFLSSKYTFAKKGMLWAIAIMHFILTITYYIYAVFNPSDSKAYFIEVSHSLSSWGDFYGTSTTFINFLAYPLVQFLGFSYESCMFLFAFFGFLGFCYFYLLLEEKNFFSKKVFGINLLYLVVLLPNLHFWSASLGKGSVIFLGFALMFFGLGKLPRRYLFVILGGLLIYHVRPHILLVVLISLTISFMFSQKGIGLVPKLFSLLIAAGILVYIYDDVVALTGLEDTSIFSDEMSGRAEELTKATSGINIENYNFFEKIFAFVYRPLFFDAPGLLGIIISFENLFYLALSLVMFTGAFWKYLFKADFLIKTSFLSFWLTSFALAQISGNLGLAIRQKSQVMILFLFVILRYYDEKKLKVIRKKLIRYLLTQKEKLQPSA